MEEEILRITKKLIIFKKNNNLKFEYIKGYIDAKLYEKEEELKNEED